MVGDVPDVLKNKRVVSLDMASMVAGAKYRGDFEERIKKALKEVQKARDVIIFIDEIHTIVEQVQQKVRRCSKYLKATSSKRRNTTNWCNYLKEYRKYIEKDAALERRFSPVTVNEPTEEETIQILKGLRDKYEAHHNVKIPDEAIKAAVELSSRYINDRYMPDKAIDVLDEAASRVRMKSYTEPDTFKGIKEEIEKLDKEKEEAIRVQDFEKAAKLRDKENEKKKELEIRRKTGKTRKAKKY